MHSPDMIPRFCSRGADRSAKISAGTQTTLLRPVKLQQPNHQKASDHDLWLMESGSGIAERPSEPLYKLLHSARHQALQLFRNSGGEFENWVTIWNFDSFDGRKPYGKVPSSIYYASLLGLSWVLSQLLCGNPSASSFSASSLQEIYDLVNALGGRYGNALEAASAKGHEQIVKLLLDKGADVNAQGEEYGNMS
ncbi:hypothetical protein V500_00651 [Pseudogymnoascus sp. VKM F-4518 (FW-2643)]|nr:hypothetical protein V500_00651 [Pseudogymnoascus sp. VKM F-4518 (FW-2643)]